MSEQLSEFLKQAKIEAMKLGSQYIGSEHFLLALMKVGQDELLSYMYQHGIYYHQIQEDLMILFGTPHQDDHSIIQTSEIAEEIIKEAKVLNEKNKIDEITCLAYALLEYENSIAVELLKRYGISIEDMKRQLINIKESLGKYPELKDLSKGNGAYLYGREKELKEMIEILSRKEKANPLLLGDAGVGKSALVEKLAWNIRNEKVPESLQDCMIYELNLNALVAGTKYRGDFEEKLQNILDLLVSHPNIIVFIDEIHMMIGAGKSEGSIDVAAVLKPYLARGKIRFIGATTIEEYEKHIEKDHALQRRFQTIILKEPNEEIMFSLLKKKAKEYENYHHVKIQDEHLKMIITYCKQFLPQKHFPDKALDILDLSCVKASIQQEQWVSLVHIKEVMEQVTNIPFTDQAYQTQLEKMKQLVTGQDQLLRKVTIYLKHLRNNGPTLGVWLFQGGAHTGKRRLASAISKCYFAKEDYLELDLRMWRQQLIPMIQMIKRNPFCLLVITHLDEIDHTIETILCSALEKGVMKWEQYSCSFYYVLVIFQYQSEKIRKAMYFMEEKADLPFFHELNQFIEERFLFEELNECNKIAFISNKLKECQIEVGEEVIVDSLRQSATMKEAYQKVKQKELEMSGKE